MKKITFFLITMILSLAVATSVNAVENIELKTSKDKVNLGEEIIVSLDLNIENKEETSLYAYTAKLSYDKDVFEVIDESDFEESENWSDITYNKRNNKFALINKKGETDESILKIKLKVRKNATPGNTSITVNSITASDGKKDIPIEGKTVDVMVIKTGLAEGESIPLNKTNEVVEDTSNIEVGKDFSWIAYILIALIIVIFIFTIYYYISSKKRNTSKNKRITIMVASIIILVILLITTIILLTDKKADVNKDGKVDYDDTKDIIEYLLEIKNPQEDENLSDKDINKDGQITIGDVAASTNQATNQDYHANVNGSNNNSNTNGSTNNQSSEANASKPNNPSNSTNPSEPSNPNEPSNPSGSTNPNEPSNPTNPTEPSNPANPNEPDNPDNPNIPSEPTKPDNPNTPSDPTKPDNPNTPSEPTKPEEQYSSVVETTTVSNLTPKKGQEITLDLYIDVTPYTEIEAIEIEGKSYKVTKVEEPSVRIASLVPVKFKAIASNINGGENNHYKVTIQAPTSAGVQDIHITKIELDNGKKVSIDYSVKVDVLKDAPKVNDFYIDDKNEIPEISFNIEDSDGAFKGGKFSITDVDGNVVFVSENIKVGKNTFSANLEDGKTYHYDLVADYDLDHDYFAENIAPNHREEKDFIDDIIEDEEGNLEFTREYNFLSKNMMITPEVSSEDELILSFENGAESYYKVTYVKVNGVEYEVKLENGKYITKLKKGSKGNNTITVESVKLENGHIFTVNQTFSYVYLKDKPTIGDIEVKLEEGNLHVSAPITDQDNTIKSVQVKIKDQNGNVIKTEKLNKNSNNGLYLNDIEIDVSGKYTVEVEVTYDLGNGKENKVSKIYAKNITEPIKATILKEQSSMAEYATRGKKVEAIYTIEDNTEKEVTHITINGVKIPATKLSDEKYKVEFLAPSERPQNGKTTIIASELYYKDEVEPIEVECAFEIEILKSVPTIEDLHINDSREKPEINFVLVDAENAFISGKIIITDENENKVTEIEMSLIDTENGIQTYTLDNIEQGKGYEISIEATYDLDIDRTNNKNEETKIIKTHKFKIEKDYEFTLSDFKFINIENEKVTLQFTSTNKTEYIIEKVEIELNGIRHEYKVIKNGDNYTIEIPLTDINNTRTELTLEEVILSNLKEFNRETDFELFSSLEKQVIFKNKPTATIGNVIVNEEETQIIVSNISIEDTDNALLSDKLTVQLRDINGTVVDSKNISRTDTAVTFDYNKAGDYKVVIVADYDIVDLQNHTNEEIAQSSIITIHIKAEIINSEFNKYPNKKEQMTIKYTIKDNTNKDVTAIYFNDIRVDAVKLGEDLYEVVYIAPTEHGKKSITASELYYGEEEVDVVDKNDEIDVLKDKPIISNFKVVTAGDKPKATFDIIDTDNSFVDGKIIIKNKANDSIKEVIIVKNDTGIITEYELEIDSFEQYEVKLQINYDLDSNILPSQGENDNVGILEQVIEIVEDIQPSKLQINDLKLKEVNEEQETITLEFTSKNPSKHHIAKVKLEGKEEEFYVTYDEASDTYTLVLPYNNGEKETITIEKVILDNDTQDEVILEEKASIELFKTKPTVQELRATYNKETKVISATLLIKDTDNIVTKAYAKVICPDGEEKTQEEVTLENKSGEVTFENITKAGTYKVEILADFNALDGKIHNSETLELEDNVTDEVYVEIKVNAVSTIELSNKYPEKGGTVQVTYNIEDNTDEKITAIEYGATHIANNLEEIDGNYKAILGEEFTAQAGVSTLKITKIHYGDKIIDVTHEGDKIDVLKEKISFNENTFTSTENLEKSTVAFTFDIINPDNAIIDGTASVGESIQNFSKAQNTLIFNVEKNKTLELLIKVNYDRDTNTIVEDENKNVETLTVVKEFSLDEDMEFDITDIYTSKVNTETLQETNTQYFNKGEEFRVNFKTATNSALKVSYVTIGGTKYNAQEINSEANIEEVEGYYAIVKASESEKGVKELNIDSVTLSDGKVITLENKNLKYEILKDKPIINTFNVSNIGTDVNILVDVLDPDDALKETAKVTITDNSNGEELFNSPIIKGTNHYEYKAELNKEYLIKVINGYDLDSNELNVGSENLNVYEELYTQQLLKIEDTAKFSAVHVTVPSIVTDDDENVILTFENVYQSIYDVKEATINGIPYTVTKEDNVYKVVLEKGEKGDNILKFTSVKLSNDSVFEVNRNIKYLYENVRPIAENIEINEVRSEDMVKATFTVNDKDEATEKLYARLYNSNGVQIEETELDKNATEVSFSLPKAYKYSIDILADYDKGNGTNYEKIVIGSKVHEVGPVVEITEFKTEDKKFFEKDEENVKLIYKINTNIDENVRLFRINGVTYDAEKIDTDTYRVLFDGVGNQGGTLTLEVQQIVFEKTMHKLENYYKSTIEVLRQKPEVSQVIAENKDGKFELSFKMKDDDEALTGNINLRILDEEEQVYLEENIQLNDKQYNKIIDNLQFNKDYKIIITANYDLDGDLTGNGNEYTGEQLLEQTIKVENNIEYNFKFSDFGLMTPDMPLAWPGYPLYLQFISTNDSQYKVDSIVLNGVGYKVEEMYGLYMISEYIPEIKSGIQEVKAEKVILSNGKAFDINGEENKAKFEVLRDYPKASILSMTEDTERGKLKIVFQIRDDFNTIKDPTDIKVLIYSSDSDEPYQTKKISIGDTEVELDTPLASEYVIEFLADATVSELMPEYNQLNSKLVEKTFEAKQSTVITEVKPETYYPEKGAIFGVNYKILTLSKKKVVAITINGQRSIVDENGTNTYKACLSANNEAGLMTFTTSTIEFEDGSTVDFKASDQVEVIKELPIITNLTRTDNFDEKSATFTFNVEDPDGIINEGGTFKGSINGQNKDLNIGENSMTFTNLTPNANIEFNVIGTYDLDTNALNSVTGKNDNNHIGDKIFTRQFLFTENNDLYRVTKLETQKNNKQNTYFEKDDEIRLKFNFIWVDDTYVEKAKVNGETYDAYKNGEDYTIVLNKMTDVGIHEIKLESIKLSNGKEIPLKENNIVKIEILKDKPSMSKFSFNDNDKDISLNITILDKDNAIPENNQLDIEVLDENNKNVCSEKLNVGENTVTFNKNDSNRYLIKVIASYDRDTNEIDQNSNEIKNGEIAFENININERKYELKDITNIDVYHFSEDGNVEKTNTIEYSKINSYKETYIVKVEMKSLPSYYGKIEEYRNENGKLVFTLSNENIILYNNDEPTEKCDIVYGTIVGDIATKEDIYSLNDSSPEGLYIPDYNRISKLQGFSTEKHKLYHNLNKLMPFYDSKYLVRDGEKIEKENILNTKLIKEVIPVNKNGEAVIAVSTDDYQNLSSIKVIFDDDEMKKYNIEFNEYYSGIASYIIPELGIEYNYNNYVIKSDARIIKDLKDTISKFNYRTDLDVLTADLDSRIYREYYEDTLKQEFDDFIKKLLVSKNYSVVIESDTYNELIKKDLLSETTLMKWIYAYNYIHRWYSFDIDGLKMSDILVFKGNLLNKPTTIESISQDVLSGNITTYSTGEFYKNKLAQYTGQQDVFEFVKYYVQKYAEDKNIETWYRDNVPGIVVEAQCINKEVQYSLWHNLSINVGKYNKYVLVLLTLPDDAAYIISNPTSILFGSQRTYVQNPKDPVQRAKLQALADSFANDVSKFFSTLSTFVSIEEMNRMSTVHLDTLLTYVDGGTGSRVVQKPLTTQEPFHKNFCEVLNDWTILKGAGAYCGGGSVYFVYEDALRAYSVWTHENAHLGAFQNLLCGGCRNRIIREDMPDGNITQGSGDGGISFNLTYDYDKNALVTTNLTTERINTPEKMKQFYSRLIDTSDFLDYIEAKAFLQLNAEQQAKLCLQVSYPKGSGQYIDGEITKYEKIDKEKIEAMHLDDVHDLWTNQIVMVPGVTERTMTPSLYGGDSIYTRHWYQPYNDNGRADSYSFKWLAFEMIATGGYKEGYRYWYGSNGGKIKNDLQSLRAITKNENMTFEQYKIDRYNKMQNNWENMKFFDATEVQKEYLEALKKDAEENDNKLTNSTAVKRKYYYMVKQGTDDFRQEIFDYVPEKVESKEYVSTAKEFVDACKLKSSSTIYLEKDIDLSEYDTGSAIVTNAFTGTIEGQNNTITGLKLPLFASLSGATVKDLIIDDSTIIINSTDIGALAKTMTGTELNNITIKGLLMSSKNNKQVGALVGSAYNSNIKDCHAINVNVFGSTRTGGLIGYAVNNCTIEESTSNATVTATADAAAVLVGECNSSTIKNCYAIGSINVSSAANYAGGIVGWADGTSIHNNYAKVSVSAVKSNSGVFSGTIRNKFDVQNNIAIANGLSHVNIGLFDNDTEASKMNSSDTFKNNYEIANGFTGKTSSARGVKAEKIKSMTIQELTKEFMQENLHWDEKIWNLDSLEEGGLPTLRNHDPNKSESALILMNESNKLDSLDELKVNDEEVVNTIEDTNIVDTNTLNTANEINNTNMLNEANETNEINNTNVLNEASTTNEINNTNMLSEASTTNEINNTNMLSEANTTNEINNTDILNEKNTNNIVDSNTLEEKSENEVISDTVNSIETTE